MTQSREKEIDEILVELEKFWKKNKEIRLGQLIDNISYNSFSKVLYLEDNTILEYLKDDNEKNRYN